jgi:GNAT superfamily N-acetyltransferase
MGLIPIGIIGMVFGLIGEALFLDHLGFLISFIITTGFFTGFYVVPLFTLLQDRAPKSSKGDVIATSNLINVTGAILASFLFFIIVKMAHLSGVCPEIQLYKITEGNLKSIQLDHGRPISYELSSTTIDGNKIAIYSELLANQRPKPASLLCYDIQKKVLTGFAAAFFFEYNAAEISLLVHPDYRQQGLARILLKKLIIDIQKERPVDNLVFSLPHQTSNTPLTQKLKTKGFQYQSSEYEMIRRQDIPIPLALDKNDMRLASYGDIETLCLIDNLCFPEGQLTDQQRFENLINRQNHRIYLYV